MTGTGFSLRRLSHVLIMLHPMCDGCVLRSGADHRWRLAKGNGAPHGFVRLILDLFGDDLIDLRFRREEFRKISQDTSG